MSLNELERRLTPKCYQCKKYKAKKLNVPGYYGQLVVFCSFICAARNALSQFLRGEQFWCPVHEEWHLESERSYCEEAQALQ